MVHYDRATFVPVKTIRNFFTLEQTAGLIDPGADYAASLELGLQGMDVINGLTQFIEKF